jgi:hypothetical protein
MILYWTVFRLSIMANLPGDDRYAHLQIDL